MAIIVKNIPASPIVYPNQTGKIEIEIVSDSTAAINSLVNNNNTASSGGTNSVTINSGAVGTAFPNQEYVDIIDGNVGGGDLFTQVIGTNTSSTVTLASFPFTAAIASGTPKAMTLLYRINTQAKAKFVELTDWTNLVKYQTSEQADFGSAIKQDSSGNITKVTKGIYIFADYVVIHPILIPVASKLTLSVGL